MSCSLLKVNQCFGRTHCRHLQDRIRWAKYQWESRCKHSNQLAGNFGLHRKQEGNGSVVPSYHWLTHGTQWNRCILTPPPSKQTKQRQEQEDDPEKGHFCWSSKKTEKKCKGVCWAGNQHSLPSQTPVLVSYWFARWLSESSAVSFYPTGEPMESEAHSSNFFLLPI
jgi:hypothetical protein